MKLAPEREDKREKISAQNWRVDRKEN